MFHVYCDESKVGGFSLAAAHIRCNDVIRLRAAVNDLRLPMQMRLHFVAESPGRRKLILKSLASIGGISTLIYDARSITDEKAARASAIAKMTVDAAAVRTSRIVLEADDPAVASDRLVINRELEKIGTQHSVGCDHLRAREEMLLAVPDAVAWCFTKGGEWMQLAEPLIADIVELDGC
jgi:hypothetical protein